MIEQISFSQINSKSQKLSKMISSLPRLFFSEFLPLPSLQLPLVLIIFLKSYSH